MMVQTITTVGPILAGLMALPLNVGDMVDGPVTVCASPWTMEQVFKHAEQTNISVASNNLSCMKAGPAQYSVNQVFGTQVFRGQEGNEVWHAAEVLDSQGFRYYALVPAYAIKR